MGSPGSSPVTILYIYKKKSGDEEVGEQMVLLINCSSVGFFLSHRKVTKQFKKRSKMIMLTERCFDKLDGGIRVLRLL